MGNSTINQGGKSLSCPTRDSHSLVLPHQHQHPITSLGYQLQPLGLLVQRLLPLLQTQRNGLCALKLTLFSTGISVDLSFPSNFASLPLVCLHSAFGLTSHPVVTGYNYAALSHSVRSPALTKHCPFAQGFFS